MSLRILYLQFQSALKVPYTNTTHSSSKSKQIENVFEQDFYPTGISKKNEEANEVKILPFLNMIRFDIMSLWIRSYPRCKPFQTVTA